MSAIALRLILGLILALSSLLGGDVGPGRKSHSPVIADFNTKLQPGVFHSWVIRPSDNDGGYIVEVSPLEKPGPMDGNYVQTAFVRPEYDGTRWNDVLRVQLPDGSAALRVNIRVYETSHLPIYNEFDALLEPGVWHGFGLSSASDQRGYVAEVTPLEPGQEGDVIEKIHLQPEFPSEWIDVLRLQIPESQPALTVHVRLYETSSLPVLMDFNTTLNPGDWQGHWVQSAKARAGYVVEISPLDNIDGAAELALVQVEFDGKTWNDVFRIMTWSDRPPLNVNVRVYQITPKK